MRGRQPNAFISLVHHASKSPTYINPATVVSVEGLAGGPDRGALLRLPDGTMFRTDTPLQAVLSMLQVPR